MVLLNAAASGVWAAKVGLLYAVAVLMLLVLLMHVKNNIAVIC